MPGRASQFDKAEELFSSEEDQITIKGRREEYLDAESIEQLAHSRGGSLIIKGLKEDISNALQKLIDTREGRYISDIDSCLTLLTKLTNSKNRVEAIGSWLDSLET